MMNTENISREHLEAWLGGDDTHNQAMITLLEIINGEYEVETFRTDVFNYNDEF